MHSNITQYAGRHQLKIGKQLGFGIHGSVFSAVTKGGVAVAIKHFYEIDPFVREFEVYCRLDENSVHQVCGFNVPQLLRVDEDLRILEMTIVARPFVLDFGGAYLDVKPAFTPEIWENGKRNGVRSTGSDGRPFGKF